MLSFIVTKLNPTIFKENLNILLLITYSISLLAFSSSTSHILTHLFMRKLLLIFLGRI